MRSPRIIHSKTWKRVRKKKFTLTYHVPNPAYIPLMSCPICPVLVTIFVSVVPDRLSNFVSISVIYL